jgi:hypothetical protein
VSLCLPRLSNRVEYNINTYCTLNNTHACPTLIMGRSLTAQNHSFPSLQRPVFSDWQVSLMRSDMSMYIDIDMHLA